jgi:hypothetical protein
VISIAADPGLFNTPKPAVIFMPGGIERTQVSVKTGPVVSGEGPQPAEKIQTLSSSQAGILRKIVT